MTAVDHKDDTYYAVDRTEFFEFIGGTHAQVLEIGCGRGASAAWLREHGGRRLVGIEINQRSAQGAAEFFDEVYAESVETALDRLTGAFDLIVCADVLEHLLDPWAIVGRLRELAGPGTVLAISIPNVRFLDTLLPIAFGSGFDYPKSAAYDPHTSFDITHVRFFTLGNIKSMLADGGWRIDRLGTPRGRRLSRLRRVLARVTRGYSNEYLAAQWYVVAMPGATSPRRG